MQLIPLHDPADNAFRLRQNGKSKNALELLAQPPGSRAAPTIVWSRRFETTEDRDTLLGAVKKGQLDTVFLGRLTMMFGSDALDELADRLVAAARSKREEKLEEAAERARKHFVVNLYAREGKHGRHLLELQRKSSDTAEWSITYDRAIERDRLCDWLRWQKGRFLGFLEHAAEHGGEALSRMLIDEMFAAERRVRAERRGAGGMRPLRMWRGD
ncbi:hypothetical protein HMP06_2251 [Sphingomonas sp. HMP6]|nr:hypothetical protein HMP06_2251 [Sphingomonas sp. HMP6]